MMRTVPKNVIEKLKAAAGPNGWLDDTSDLSSYLTEQRRLFTGSSPLILRPDNVDAVSEILAICHEARVPVVPQGGNTGLVGGGIPYEHGGEVVLNTSRLNKIRALDPQNFTITAEAGCVLADIQRAASDSGRFFPLSLGAEGSCQIGGNLSTNAGGTAVLRYGNMRELTLGLEVVLADGTIWDDLTGLRKNNTGYDLKHLFIGGEGTLGVITAAVLKLFPTPKSHGTALIAIGEIANAVDLLGLARSECGDAVTGFEYMPGLGIDLALKHIPDARNPLSEVSRHTVLLELSSSASDWPIGRALEALLSKALENGFVLDAAIAQNESQRKSFWRLREAIPEAQRVAGASIKHDVSVPVSAVPAFIESASAAVVEALPGIVPIPFGHVGDGNIHFNLMQPAGMERDLFLKEWPRFNRIVHDIVDSLGGSISAEHGIGRIKRDELRRYAAPTKLDLIRKVKRTLDPHGILNPGKLI